MANKNFYMGELVKVIEKLVNQKVSFTFKKINDGWGIYTLHWDIAINSLTGGIMEFYDHRSKEVCLVPTYENACKVLKNIGVIK